MGFMEKANHKSSFSVTSGEPLHYSGGLILSRSPMSTVMYPFDFSPF